MNEIQTIREALNACLKRSAPGELDDAYEALYHLEKLLPPEGETHSIIHDATEQIRIEALVRDSRGEYRINLTKVEEILHRFFAEPAPSSEKALREAVDAWGCQHDHPDIMREIDDLLSSPAVAQDKSAPEAPKEEWTGKPCPKCKGTGIDDPERDTRACSACGGTGEEYKSERSATT